MIYFIRRADSGRIKIGTTINLMRRLKVLCKEVDGELRVLAVFDGARDVERSLHERFSHLRADGEWFEPGDDLIGFVVQEGRPWDGEVEDDRPDIRLRVDGELQRRIQEAADQEGNSVAAFIRAAVVKELKRREKEATE